MAFYTYILASRRNGTLYTGSTDSIEGRTGDHKQNLRARFTAKYGVHTLVWYEVHDSREAAFRRERQIKKWRRVWKLDLIERRNPRWIDVLEDSSDFWKALGPRVRGDERDEIGPASGEEFPRRVIVHDPIPDGDCP